MEKNWTIGEPNITCPSCEITLTEDSWDINADEGEEVCEQCGAKYTWSREHEITYSSEIAQD